MADKNPLPQRGTIVNLDLVREQLAKGFAIRLRVGGTSMLPLIPPGAVVMIRPLADGLLRVGDVAAIETSGHILCHQVTCITGQGDAQQIQTRGIANRNKDAPSGRNQVLGVVQSIEIGPFRLTTKGIPYAGFNGICRITAPLTRFTLSIVSVCRRAVLTILQNDR